MHPHDYNPDAPTEFKSFGGSAFETVWESCDWDKLVVEFLCAVESARAGNLEPLKGFITETLGEPWQDRLGVIDDFGFLEARRRDYDFTDRWPEEAVRFMAADRQQSGGEHYFYVVRAFGTSCQSRLAGYGRAETRTQLEELRQNYGVKSSDAMMDTGFKASELYPFCLSTGWKAFKGDDADFFLHRDSKTTKTVRRIWDRTLVDPFFDERRGRVPPMPLYRFSNNAAKDLLASQMKGVTGAWTVPNGTGKDYFQQLTAEVRVEKVDKQGRLQHIWKQVRPDNHYLDCELMIQIAAVVRRLINVAPLNERTENPGQAGQTPAVV